MKLPFIRRKQEQKNRFYPGSHSYLRQSIPKQKRQIKIHIGSKKLIIILLALLTLIIGGMLGLSYIRTSTDFNIKKIDFIAEGLDEESMTSIESRIIGQNIFGINNQTIEKDIKNTIQNVKAVIITKDLPSTIRVRIDKYIPTIIAISFDTQIILDEELKLIEFKKLNPSLMLNKFQTDLLQGVVDLTSNDLQSYVIQSLTAEEKEVFAWDKLSDEEKRDYVSKFEMQTKNQVNDFFTSIENNLPENLKNVQVLRFYSNIPEEQIRNTIDNEYNLYDFSYDLGLAISKLNIKAVKFDWISQNSLRVTLDNNKSLFFSFKRKLTDQLKDLETALVNGIIDGAANIDFRTVNFSSWN